MLGGASSDKLLAGSKLGQVCRGRGQGGIWLPFYRVDRISIMIGVSEEIPVIDLFAGPGGLCEGFSSLKNEKGRACFAVKVSIEKDAVAHRTLLLRAIFRKFPKGKVPKSYYQYVRGEIGRDEFLALPEIKDAAKEAFVEARCAELGVTPHATIDSWIKEALNGSQNWVLIGGPPCQAYSLAGRSRLRPRDPKAFENDKRHLLYIEYLRIIQEFSPSIFVMENVKGMLNSKHQGSRIFERILADLSNPREGLSYQVRSFAVEGTNLKPNDYIIEAENYGIPQNRHRVILFGIRSDVAAAIPALVHDPAKFVLKKKSCQIGVSVALSGLPRLRSQLSKEQDSPEAWLDVMKKAPSTLKFWSARHLRSTIEALMASALTQAKQIRSTGARFIETAVAPGNEMPEELRKWILDDQLQGVLQHATRKHMRSDLQRYLFAACFAESQHYAPNLTNFPPRLLPAHVNIDEDTIPFKDRFRVQVGKYPSSTVVSHIQKDGHYYIHPDPAQCRSFTVREVARLQTFPDNYFFEGNQTEQYGQVGNAVPPLLANKIARIIYRVLAENPRS